MQIQKQVHVDLEMDDEAVQQMDLVMFNLLSRMASKKSLATFADVESAIMKQVILLF